MSSCAYLSVEACGAPTGSRVWTPSCGGSSQRAAHATSTAWPMRLCIKVRFKSTHLQYSSNVCVGKVVLERVSSAHQSCTHVYAKPFKLDSIWHHENFSAILNFAKNLLFLNSSKAIGPIFTKIESLHHADKMFWNSGRFVKPFSNNAQMNYFPPIWTWGYISAYSDQHLVCATP